MFTLFLHLFGPFEVLIESRLEVNITGSIYDNSGDKSYLTILSSKMLPSGMGPFLAIFTLQFWDQDQDQDRYWTFSAKILKDLSSKK